jgi:hypothetical protein
MDNSKSRWSRKPVDVSRYQAKTAKQTGPLGYAQGLSKMEAVEMLSDSRFLQDVKDFYYQRDGRMFSSDEEAVEKFWSDRTWRNSNVLMTGVDAIASQGYTTEQKERLGRI